MLQKVVLAFIIVTGLAVLAIPSIAQDEDGEPGFFDDEFYAEFIVGECALEDFLEYRDAAAESLLNVGIDVHDPDGISLFNFNNSIDKNPENIVSIGTRDKLRTLMDGWVLVNPVPECLREYHLKWIELFKGTEKMVIAMGEEGEEINYFSFLSAGGFQASIDVSRAAGWIEGFHMAYGLSNS